MTADLPIPPPFVIDVDFAATTLIVNLRIFGLAQPWAKEAASTLQAALMRGVSGKVTEPGLEILACDIARQSGEHVAPDATAATLRFQTPVALIRNGRLLEDFSGLMSALGNRISGIARWHGLRIDADWSDVKAASRNLAFDGSRLERVQWTRGSKRQGGRVLIMEGWLGPLEISGDLKPFLQLLVLGEVCHVGSHAALGLGRYGLSLRDQ
ncbi:CRISPR system precrRNA processing endoribonuclease RAMP protein Cas6 [Pelagibius sp. Alg239-R121]|uniref:CRISPR system precrRNA processing endoribonuclease RAMP protein Cas6 n=1 Tax=Pelagibius sp. Alg239-R121 TaxID=2993448 RepID=UPI0024A6A7CF|nr:CRISPR system precrRNA processing endoribonuclease RAMP protein Cas6 [Pelagibius sp. Alg239-R121]